MLHPPGQPPSADFSPSIHHPSWHYTVRTLEHGEWSVERGQAEAGGTFTTCAAALRFLGSDLETVVLAQMPEIH